MVSPDSAGGRLPLRRGRSIWLLGSGWSGPCCLGRLAALCRLRCEAKLVRSLSFYPHPGLDIDFGGGGPRSRLAHWLAVAMVCPWRWFASPFLCHHDDVRDRGESATGLLGIRRCGWRVSAGGECWQGLTKRCSQPLSKAYSTRVRSSCCASRSGRGRRPNRV